MDWLERYWMLLAPLVMGGLAVAWLMPRYQGRRTPVAGGLLGMAALATAGFFLIQPDPNAVTGGLFYLFAGTAIVAAVCMITNENPVYAALWFALVTLSVCGLFLLQSAPFLAAATVIVYAGAIIVTFVFVIMLARQSGAAAYDQEAQQPLLATVSAFLLLGGLLVAQTEWRSPGGPGTDKPADGAAAKFLLPPDGIDANPSSARASTEGPVTMRAFGRSLFGDYMFAVEIAGTLLMVATIGAVAISPRRSQGGL